MIRIDPRAGSCDLIEPLRRIGVEVAVVNMDYGDLAFEGNGPDGAVAIGIEYKKMEDLIQCVNDNRFLGHQLPGMLEAYDHLYLVIEGTPLWQADGGFKNYEGSLHRWRRSHSNISLMRLLSTVLHIEALGARTMFLPSQRSALTYIVALYTWWNKKWGDHSKAPSIHYPMVPLLVPSLRQKIASLLPGIGQGKLMAIEEAFQNSRAMVNATAQDWIKLKGIGKKTADQIEEVLSNE